MDGVHLLLGLITLEDRQTVFVFLHLLDVAGDQHLHLVARDLVGFLALNQNLVNFTCIQVTNGPLDQVAFFMDQAWGLRFQRTGADFVPQLRQIGVVTRNFGFCAFGTGGAYNHGYAVRRVQPADNAFQALAVGGIGDFPADTASAG